MTATWLGPVGAAMAQPATGVSLRDDCQARFQEYVAKKNPGHFFYVEDPSSKKHSNARRSRRPTPSASAGRQSG